MPRTHDLNDVRSSGPYARTWWFLCIDVRSIKRDGVRTGRTEADESVSRLPVRAVSPRGPRPACPACGEPPSTSTEAWVGFPITVGVDWVVDPKRPPRRAHSVQHMGATLPILAGMVSRPFSPGACCPCFSRRPARANCPRTASETSPSPTFGNAVHTVYVFHLPPGPIWFLHSFYVVSSALMLYCALSPPPHSRPLGARRNRAGRRGRSETGTMTSRERLQAAWDHTPLPIETAAGRIGRAGAARATAPAPGVDPSRRLDAHRLRARPSDCRTTRPGAGSLEEPSTLVTRGLHGRSRNPIYLGCNAIHLGLAEAIRNAWMLASFPVSAALLHRCAARGTVATREVRRRVRRLPGPGSALLLTLARMAPPVGLGRCSCGGRTRLRRHAENRHQHKAHHSNDDLRLYHLAMRMRGTLSSHALAPSFLQFRHDLSLAQFLGAGTSAP